MDLRANVQLRQEALVAIAGRVRKAAAVKRCTPDQFALAWLLDQGDDIVPFPGTKRHRHLDENLGALDVQLTPGEMESLFKRIPPEMTRSARHPEAQTQRVNL